MGALSSVRQGKETWAVQQGAPAAKGNAVSSLTPSDSFASAAAGAARGTGRERKTNRADTNAGSGKALQKHELFPFTFW